VDYFGTTQYNFYLFLPVLYIDHKFSKNLYDICSRGETAGLLFLLVSLLEVPILLVVAGASGPGVGRSGVDDFAHKALYYGTRTMVRD
jgi:hypothetical protein